MYIKRRDSGCARTRHAAYALFPPCVSAARPSERRPCRCAMVNTQPISAAGCTLRRDYQLGLVGQRPLDGSLSQTVNHSKRDAHDWPAIHPRRRRHLASGTNSHGSRHDATESPPRPRLAIVDVLAKVSYAYRRPWAQGSIQEWDAPHSPPCGPRILRPSSR
jgi:hypothetical protein